MTPERKREPSPLKSFIANRVSNRILDFGLRIADCIRRQLKAVREPSLHSTIPQGITVTFFFKLQSAIRIPHSAIKSLS